MKYSLPDVVNDAFEFDRFTLVTKVGAAFVPGISGEKSAICSENIEGKKA